MEYGHRDLSVAERSGAYRLLASLLSSPPSADRLDGLTRIGDDGRLGPALARLANASRDSDATAVADEFQRLFVGLDGGEITPYASHYLAGTLHDLPLVRLREDMRRIGLAKPRDVGEPEDHASSVMEIAAGLIDGSIPCEPDRFLGEHVLPWLPRLFRDLSKVQGAPFYATVGSLGLAFLAGEGPCVSEPPRASP